MMAHLRFLILEVSNEDLTIRTKQCLLNEQLDNLHVGNLKY